MIDHAVHLNLGLAEHFYPIHKLPAWRKASRTPALENHILTAKKDLPHPFMVLIVCLSLRQAN